MPMTVSANVSTITPATTATPTLLEVQHLDRRFGTVQALSDVSLTVPTGSVTALVGDNGAGKSVLITCISGIHAPDRHTRPVIVDEPRAALGAIATDCRWPPESRALRGRRTGTNRSRSGDRHDEGVRSCTRSRATGSS